MNAEREFTVDGVEYKVLKPNQAQLEAAETIKSKTFTEELNAGALLRRELDAHLRKRKLWSDEEEMEYKTLQQEIIDLDYRLSQGNMKKSEGKAIALDIRRKRNRMIQMLSARTELDSYTCEGKSESARFNYLFSQCLVYKDSGKPYFAKGLEDYLNNMNDPVAIAGATEFYYVYSNSDNVDEQLPENKFLKRFGFVNEEYRLVDKEGKLVDESGRHIDENGYYIKWLSETEYCKVDEKGRELDDDGNYITPEEAFFEDDDEETVSESSSEPEETEKKKTTRKTKATA